MSALADVWGVDFDRRPGGFWNNLPEPEQTEPLLYDIYDDSAATDAERMFAVRLILQAYNDDNDYYDTIAKVVAAAFARLRGQEASS
jgi:hypothetical protein